MRWRTGAVNDSRGAPRSRSGRRPRIRVQRLAERGDVVRNAAFFDDASGQTRAAASSFVTMEPADSTRARSVSKALGVTGTNSPDRNSARVSDGAETVELKNADLTGTMDHHSTPEQTKDRVIAMPPAPWPGSPSIHGALP